MQSEQLIILLLAVALIVSAVIIAYLIKSHNKDQKQILKLIMKVQTLKKQLEMKNNKSQSAPNIYCDTYIAEIKNDIHDNHNCTINACPTNESKSEGTNERGNDDMEAAYQPPVPKEGDYNAVREYIAERKKYDEQFRIYWDSHTLKQNCIYLTKELGWIVDDHSLGTNLNRHR